MIQVRQVNGDCLVNQYSCIRSFFLMLMIAPQFQLFRFFKRDNWMSCFRLLVVFFHDISCLLMEIFENEEYMNFIS